MEAKELRIGNQCLYDGKFIIVTAITRSGVFSVDEKIGFNQLHPIQITEEILLKAGWDKFNQSAGYINDLHISLTKDYCLIIISDEYLIEANELHRLQNIVYDLTGKELEIKL